MASGVKNFYNGLPPAGKVLVVAGVGVGAYLVYRHFKKEQEKNDATKAAQAAANELATLQQQGIMPSYTDSEFKSMVDALVQAMNGCGTDETVIYDIIGRMHNDADIRKLVSTFGLQYYEPCAAISPLSYLRWQFDDQAYGGELSTWLNYFPSPGFIAHINSILASNGIHYQF